MMVEDALVRERSPECDLRHPGAVYLAVVAEGREVGVLAFEAFRDDLERLGIGTHQALAFVVEGDPEIACALDLYACDRHQIDDLGTWGSECPFEKAFCQLVRAHKGDHGRLA